MKKVIIVSMMLSMVAGVVVAAESSPERARDLADARTQLTALTRIGTLDERVHRYTQIGDTGQRYKELAIECVEALQSAKSDPDLGVRRTAYGWIRIIAHTHRKCVEQCVAALESVREDPDEDVKKDIETMISAIRRENESKKT